jgi:hypothetical protein
VLQNDVLPVRLCWLICIFWTEDGSLYFYLVYSPSSWCDYFACSYSWIGSFLGQGHEGSLQIRAVAKHPRTKAKAHIRNRCLVFFSVIYSVSWVLLTPQRDCTHFLYPCLFNLKAELVFMSVTHEVRRSVLFLGMKTVCMLVKNSRL